MTTVHPSRFARRRFPFLAGTVLLASLLAAATRSAPRDDAPAAASEISTDGEHLFAVPTTLDRFGRILAPVEIDGHGPLRFILDTGANRSAMSAATATRLGLAVDNETTVLVHGITGSAVLPTVLVSSFRTGDLVLQARRLPVLPAAVFGNADGILGIDSLQHARIEVDFENDQVTITRSPVRRTTNDYLIVPARVRHGGLLLVKAKVGRVRVQAVLDTGAERSLGNEALRQSLLLRRNPQSSEETATTVIGATPQLADGRSFRAPPIFMGGARLDDLIVTFGDLHVFNIWSLNHEPAIIIGMDLLGTLQRLVIDYPRREFYLRP